MVQRFDLSKVSELRRTGNSNCRSRPLRDSGKKKRQQQKLGQQREDPRFDLIGGERLADVAPGSGCDGTQDEGFTAFGCDHDGWDSGRKILAAARLEELEAVHDGHVNVADDERKWAGGTVFVAKRLKCLFAV